jgi:hypothetical protein
MRSVIFALIILVTFIRGAKEQTPDMKELSELRSSFSKEYDDSQKLLPFEIALQVANILKTQTFVPAELTTIYLDAEGRLDQDFFEVQMRFLRKKNFGEEKLNKIHRMFWAGVEYIGCLKLNLIKRYIQVNPDASYSDIDEFRDFYPHLKYSYEYLYLSQLYLVYLRYINGGSVYAVSPRNFVFGNLKDQIDIIRSGYILGRRDESTLEKSINIFKFIKGLLCFNYTAENRVLRALKPGKEVDQNAIAFLTDYLNCISNIDARLSVLNLW